MKSLRRIGRSQAARAARRSSSEPPKWRSSVRIEAPPRRRARRRRRSSVDASRRARISPGARRAALVLGDHRRCPGATSASLNGRSSPRAGERALELGQRHLARGAVDALLARRVDQLARACSRQPPKPSSSPAVAATKRSSASPRRPGVDRLARPPRRPSARLVGRAADVDRGAGVEQRRGRGAGRGSPARIARVTCGVLLRASPPATASQLGRVEADVPRLDERTRRCRRRATSTTRVRAGDR